MDALSILEEEADELARARSVAFARGRTMLSADVADMRVRASTQPSFFDPAEGQVNQVNTDSLLVQPCRIGGDTALLLAVATGNYKDDASCLASLCAVCALAKEFEGPLVAGVDVPPALRRAFISADGRIRALAEVPLGPRTFSTCVGLRKTLEGIGASVVAAVVGPAHIWMAHVGENRAVIVRGGVARQLVLPHTLAHHPEYRARAGELTDLPADEIVLRVLGFGHDHLDLLRCERADAERLILAGPSATLLDSDVAKRGAGDVLEFFTRESTTHKPWMPASIIVADLAGPDPRLVAAPGRCSK